MSARGVSDISDNPSGNQAGAAKLKADSKAKWLPGLIFAAAVLFWISFSALAAPSFGGIDSFIFRDPGCALAAGDGFVSRSVPHGGAAIAPEVYALYTPGAPALFALPVKLFGCTSRTDTFYNLFFYVLAVGLTLIALFRALKSLRTRLIISVVAGILLPGGLFFTEGDRPEEPAFCLLLGMLLLWRYCRTDTARIILTGLSGLVFLIHPLAGIMGLLLFGYLLVFEESPAPLSSRLLVACSGGVIFCAIVVVCIVYLQHLDPTVVHRFLGHAFGADTGAGVVLNGAKPGQAGPFHGYVVAFRRVFSFHANFLNGVLNVSAVTVSGLLFLYTLLRFAKGREARKIWIEYAALIAITLLFPLLLFFAQQYYFTLTNGMMLGKLCLGGDELAKRARRSTAPLAILAVTLLFIFPPTLVHILEPLETRASYKQAEQQAQRIAKIFAKQKISNRPILANYYQFYMYKPYFKNLYDTQYLEPHQSTDMYAGLLLCDTSMFPGEKQMLEPLHAADWKLVDSAEETVRIHLFGHPIMRRNWAWSCDAYVRK